MSKTYKNEKEAADAVPVPGEVGLVVELVAMPVELVGDDVLDLEGVLAFPSNVLGVLGRLARLGSDVVGHPGEDPMNLVAVLLVHPEP